MGHDIMKTQVYWQQVFDNEGLNIQRNVKGHRGDELRAAGNSNRGGKRTKMTKEEAMGEWWHPDAKEEMEVFLKDSTVKYEKRMSTCIESLWWCLLSF